VDRKDFQELAKVRLKEANALFRLGLYDGAYYLAGYAVECALKACIAKGTRRYEFPDKKRVEDSYSQTAGLDQCGGARESARRANSYGSGFSKGVGDRSRMVGREPVSKAR
jgi:HEPN domain